MGTVNFYSSFRWLLANHQGYWNSTSPQVHFDASVGRTKGNRHSREKTVTSGSCWSALNRLNIGLLGYSAKVTGVRNGRAPAHTAG